MMSMGLDAFAQSRHVTKTADELLLSGYTDNIIALGSRLPMFDGSKHVPDKFGWFYGVWNKNINAIVILKLSF